MEACTHAATPTHMFPLAFAYCAKHAILWTYTHRACRYTSCTHVPCPYALSMSRRQAHTHTSPVQQAGAGAMHSARKLHACCHTGRHCSPRSPPARRRPLCVDKMPHAPSASAEAWTTAYVHLDWQDAHDRCVTHHTCTGSHRMPSAPCPHRPSCRIQRLCMHPYACMRCGYTLPAHTYRPGRACPCAHPLMHKDPGAPRMYQHIPA